MKIDQIKDQMQEMTVGFTKVICDQVVTRWSKDKWEVGTFGKDSMNIDFAAGFIVFVAISEMVN